MVRLNKGDRIRLKKRLLGGWKGFGIVICHEHCGLVEFHKENEPEWIRCLAMRHEVAKVREKKNASL
jgi:hypothetical protein